MTARLIEAATPARREWAAAAASRCASRRVAASIKVLGDRVAATHPLGTIIERGARPHEIDPHKKALKLANGSFAAVVEHPGSRAQPFMRPTLPLWGPIYRRLAAGAVRGI